MEKSLINNSRDWSRFFSKFSYVQETYEAMKKPPYPFEVTYNVEVVKGWNPDGTPRTDSWCYITNYKPIKIPIMKKFIALFVLVLAFSLNAASQITSTGKPEVINSFRMGTCKLVKTGDVYAIDGQTKDNRFLRMNVVLGDKEKAAALIQSMIDYTAGKNERVALNNPTENFAIWVGPMLGGWEITDTAGVDRIAVSKGELKKILKSMQE